MTSESREETDEQVGGWECLGGAGGAQKAWPCLQTLPLLPQGKHTGGGKSRRVQVCGRRMSGEAGRAAVRREVAAGEAGGSGAPRKGSAPNQGVPGAASRGLEE